MQRKETTLDWSFSTVGKVYLVTDTCKSEKSAVD